VIELEELLENIDAVEYISQFVELEEKNGEWWGLSPFKDENTPSFSVRRETGKFFDFSSGLGGSLVTFVQHYFSCTKGEAVQKLYEYAGLCSGGHENIKPRRKISASMVCRRFTKPKNHTKTSKASVYPSNYMERYEKRWDKLSVWENEGISRASLDKFEVYYDGFSDRIVYPIRNMQGKIVNIGGRTLDPDWKTKNLRKYTYFSAWGTLDLVYGAYENLKSILDKREIIIFEGCKSVLLANSWGITNTGALLTSHANPAQVKLLARLGCRVVFALDKEVDVRKDHNIARLKRYVNVEYIYDRDNLLDDKDAPVDKGKEVFERLYGQRYKYR
jgi:DNA primase